jgi:hypothetical protein
MNRVNPTALLICERVHCISRPRLLGFPSTSLRRLNPPGDDRLAKRDAVGDAGCYSSRVTISSTGGLPLLSRFSYRRQPRRLLSSNPSSSNRSCAKPARTLSCQLMMALYEVGQQLPAVRSASQTLNRALRVGGGSASSGPRLISSTKLGVNFADVATMTSSKVLHAPYC